MVLKVIPVGPLEVNCVILERKGKALVVDPGAEGKKIVNQIDDLEVIGIICTHGHIDHTGQVGFLKDVYSVPFYLHREDTFLLNNEIWGGFGNYIGAVSCPQPDVFLEEGMSIPLADLTLKVIHSPGHTPGSCLLYLEDFRVLITGDLIFKGSVGRWDLPGGDLRKLKKSLNKILKEFPEDTLMICGHYEETLLEIEKKSNPYLIGDLI